MPRLQSIGIGFKLDGCRFERNEFIEILVGILYQQKYSSRGISLIHKNITNLILGIITE